MRIITTGLVTAASAVATVAGAAVALADQPPAGGPNEIITVDINLLGCSLGAGLGAELLPALTAAANGSTVGINSGVATRLRAAGCLPRF